VKVPSDYKDNQIVYEMMNESLRTVYNDAQTERFTRSLVALVLKGNMTDKQADTKATEFNQNQILAKASVDPEFLKEFIK